VAHGAGDTPDALCGTFRDLVGDRGVILCPAGPRIAWNAEGRYFPDHFALERIVLASLEALAAAYPGAVDRASVVYGGYSQGATMGALMLPSHGAELPRLLLVEGGFDEWTVARAAAFHEGGGRRVLFACGREQCRAHAEHAATWLRSGGVEARVVARVGSGHTYGGAVAEAVRSAFTWLVEGDSRWEASMPVVGSKPASVQAPAAPGAPR
jgi:predicted esterase